MKQATARPGITRIGFYVGVIVFTVAVWQFQSRVAGTYVEPYVDSLSPLQEKQLDAFLEMNRLLTTLGTGLLGAMGFLLVNSRTSRSGSRQTWTALGSALCVALSVYFGYLVYLGVLWMLDANFFNLNDPRILWPRQAHFYSFLLGVLLFGDFAFHDLRGEDKRERSQDVADH
jgi:glucan phosphoethanolaminetransferase (alkaline phosphatase superfamily)